MIVIVAGAVAAYLAVVALVTLVQRRLIYHPDATPPVPPPGIAVVQARTADGLDLACWSLPAAPGCPTALYLHGNGGNLRQRAGRVAHFARLGWGALLVGYRGYGGNPGAPSERGLLEDARAGLALLHRQGVAPDDVVAWGESLGSGVAVQLAAGVPIGALVLEAPYTSLTDIARRQFRWLPVRLLLRDRYDSLARIRDVGCPVFVLAGTADWVVPPAQSQRLFAAAREPKQLRLVPDAGHNDLGTDAAFDAVAAFIASAGRGRRSPGHPPSPPAPPPHAAP